MDNGFTLIELMVVTTILGILSAVAVPHFLAYRDSSRVAAVASTAAGIRAALANYAVDSPGNLYPFTGDIGGWDALRTIVNANGGELKSTSASMDIVAIDYTSEDGTVYALSITVAVSEDMPNHIVPVTPAGITRQ